MSKTNGKGKGDTAGAAVTGKRTRRKTKIILQELRTVHLVPADRGDGATPDPNALDYHHDWVGDCAGVRDARKKRRASAADGKFRVIEVLDEFEVTHEQTTNEVITRSGQ